MKKKVVPKLQPKVKVTVKVDIVTSDIKIFYIGKFQDFTARYIIKMNNTHCVKRLYPTLRCVNALARSRML